MSSSFWSGRLPLPLALRDRPWSDLQTAWMYSSVDVPSADAVRVALQQLAQARPGHRLFRRLDAPRNRWISINRRDLDDWISQIATPLTDRDVDDTATVARWTDMLSEGPAYRLGLGGDALVMASEHAFSDGSSGMFIQQELLQAAREGRPPHALIKGSASLALTRGMIAQTRQDPQWLTRHSQPSGATKDASVSTHSPLRLVREPSRLVRTAQLYGDPWNAVSAWRRQYAPDVSRAAVMSALIRAVLDDAGIALAPTITMLMDARRFLNCKPAIAGNLVSALPITPTDGHDPRTIDAEIREYVRSKRPLYATAHSAVGAAIPSRFKRPRPATDGIPQLLLSHMRTDFLEHPVTWIGTPAGRRYTTITGASDGRSIGHNVAVTVLESDSVTFVSGLIDPSRVDAARFEAAIDYLSSAPLHLLSRRDARLVELRRRSA